MQMALASSHVRLRLQCQHGTLAASSRRCRVHAPRAESSSSEGNTQAEVQQASNASTQFDSEEQSWSKPFTAGQIFGSYLQVGVWVTVLSIAAYTGFQKVRSACLGGCCASSVSSSPSVTFHTRFSFARKRQCISGTPTADFELFRNIHPVVIHTAMTLCVAGPDKPRGCWHAVGAAGSSAAANRQLPHLPPHHWQRGLRAVKCRSSVMV